MSDIRLIDANALMPLFIEKAYTMKDRHGVKLGETWLLSYDDIKDVIDNAPTVAQPTGIWVNDAVYPYRCTNCGEYAANCYPFCPWCRAKMKGGEGDG